MRAYFFIIFEIDILMKDKTIDYILRATWQLWLECIMKKRRNTDASMATDFIEYRQGRWNAIDFFRVQRWGWKQQA
jgi:hypothetical protein